MKPSYIAPCVDPAVSAIASGPPVAPTPTPTPRLIARLTTTEAVNQLALAAHSALAQQQSLLWLDALF